MKIGPVDTEIALLKVKKEEINASKIYTPSGKFAERANEHLAAKPNLYWPNYEIGYCTADWISMKFGEQIGRYMLSACIAFN